MSTPARSIWDDLVAGARLIPNSSDRSFVLMHLSGCLPGKYASLKNELLSEAKSTIENIPSAFEQAYRFRNLAEVARDGTPTLVSSCLRSAMLLSPHIEDQEEAQLHRRKILDIADQIRDGLADDLIELLDDDPARILAKQEIKASLAVTKLKRALADSKDVTETKPHKIQFAEAAWKNLEALISGKLETKNLELMSSNLTQASSFEIGNAYPVLAWYIENSNRRFSALKDIDGQILPVAESMLLCSEIAHSVISVGNSRAQIKIALDKNTSSMPPLLKPSSRDEAIEYIRTWLRENGADYVKLCDPYFGPSDVDFLRLVVSEAPHCQVYILTSKKKLSDEKALTAEPFLIEWKKSVSQAPPDTEVIALEKEADEKTILHDRWLITKNAGLRLGTSFHSLGDGKLSEISQLDPTKLQLCESQLDKYLARERVVDGVRLRYIAFTL